MTPEARAMLDQIDLFLCRQDQASREVAAVLSAIRSEDHREIDFSSECDKRISTIPIRRAAFPMLANGEHLYIGNSVTIGERYMGMDLDSNEDGAKVTLKRHGDEHFNGHAELAAAALGLTVEYRD